MEQLYPRSISGKSVEIPFSKAVLDSPVFRSYTTNGPWMYSGCYKALTQLGIRMGYSFPLTPYVIRRGAMKLIDSKFHYLKGYGVYFNISLGSDCSTAEKNLIFGHKRPETMQQKYSDRNMAVEIQLLYDGETANSNISQPLRGMASKRFPGAPDCAHDVNSCPTVIALR